MTYQKITVEHDKRIALIAHDNKKRDLIEWAKYNRLIRTVSGFVAYYWLDT